MMYFENRKTKTKTKTKTLGQLGKSGLAGKGIRFVQGRQGRLSAGGRLVQLTRMGTRLELTVELHAHNRTARRAVPAHLRHAIGPTTAREISPGGRLGLFDATATFSNASSTPAKSIISMLTVH